MASSDMARQRAFMPAGTSRILNARSLVTAHRRLADVLKPGNSVLDVGCGTGAITRDIARKVAPHGFVVGVDSNAHLIEQARHEHRDITNLRFAVGDVYSLPFTRVFDVVTAARVLQWLSEPQDALRAMREATRPQGRVIVLDYNHENVQWRPAPPVSMQQFYATFLRWRSEAGMNNAIADHLTPMFRAAGFADILETPQHEVAMRQDPDFAAYVGIWAEVAATRGYQMVADGLLTETQRATAEVEYRIWIQTAAEAQTLYMLAVEGTVTSTRRNPYACPSLPFLPDHSGTHSDRGSRAVARHRNGGV